MTGNQAQQRRCFPLWALAAVLAMVSLPRTGHAVELKMSRAALQRTLEQELFPGPEERYYLKGGPKSACWVYAEQPAVSFSGDRVTVTVKVRAHLGRAVGGHCLEVTLAPSSEVSMVPNAEGETIGFRDARVEHVSESKELNFLLTPFLSHKIPSNMNVNAADMLRKALVGSTAASGYAVHLDRLKIHSMTIEGDWIVVDADGDLSVQ